MQKGISRTKKVPGFALIALNDHFERRVIPISGSISISRQLGHGQRGKQNSKPGVLHKSIGLRHRKKISMLVKLAFVLITLARSLRPYFQAHTIVVLIDQPL